MCFLINSGLLGKVGLLRWYFLIKILSEKISWKVVPIRNKHPTPWRNSQIKLPDVGCDIVGSLISLITPPPLEKRGITFSHYQDGREEDWKKRQNSHKRLFRCGNLPFFKLLSLIEKLSFHLYYIILYLNSITEPEIFKIERYYWICKRLSRGGHYPSKKTITFVLWNRKVR